MVFFEWLAKLLQPLRDLFFRLERFIRKPPGAGAIRRWGWLGKGSGAREQQLRAAKKSTRSTLRMAPVGRVTPPTGAEVVRNRTPSLTASIGHREQRGRGFGYRIFGRLRRRPR